MVGMRLVAVGREVGGYNGAVACRSGSRWHTMATVTTKEEQFKWVVAVSGGSRDRGVDVWREEIAGGVAAGHGGARVGPRWILGGEDNLGGS